MTDSKKTIVLYDGECPLCRRSVRLLKRLDWYGSLSYLDARTEADLPEAEPALVREELLDQMHIVTEEGTASRGFLALRALAWKLPMLWPTVPILYLPGVRWLGEKLYGWVARNRMGLVSCHDGLCHVSEEYLAARSREARRK